MATGLILTLLGGSLWAVLGMVTACGKKRNAPIELVQPLAGGLILIFAGWSVFLEKPLQWNRGGVILTLVILTVGWCNYFMMNLVQRGMRSGHEGVVWAFSQSAMISPFIMGIIFFHEPATLFRLGGVALIVTALFTFALARPNSNGRSNGWFVLTLAAFVLAGLGQCCATLPSYFRLPGMTPLRRMLLLQCGILSAFLTDHLVRRKPVGLRNRNVWLLAAVFGAANLIALILFYSGQNLLAAAQCASISYPVGQGASIGLVFLYSARRTPPGRLACLAFILLLAGLSLLALQDLVPHELKI